MSLIKATAETVTASCFCTLWGVQIRRDCNRRGYENCAERHSVDGIPATLRQQFDDQNYNIDFCLGLEQPGPDGVLIRNELRFRGSRIGGESLSRCPSLPARW
jgi:hypothetical protein